ncbi:protein arginine methyltransferase NDUFAF7, mitochondrial isoform X2 [Nothobranchius furzeri]|uniref:Protein arginine methyltransferase NDUFAF7 n=1 Tax=Nothobranchius furzeri TaxID=105023 RepID=A0A9D2Z4V2_NOTFU|nr:transcript variant X2 [Nothobranchius furzeri]
MRLSRAFIRAVSSPATVAWRSAQSRIFCSSPSDYRKSQPSMLKHLTSKIKATGPVSVAEYMREVLTNPVTGYYVRNNMLGPDGDFITSPEISQVFGELLGVWIISEWMAAGRPKQLQLVELGPGNGSLAADVLRVFGQLQSVLGGASVSLHLMEVSPALSDFQAQTLTGGGSQKADCEEDPVYRHGTTAAGLPVSWYRCLEDVPAGFSIFVAHEFFDSLPVHKFQGFKDHQLHDVLLSPGSADLTADVDFSFLRRMAGGGVACLGPVTQGLFLKNMGIDTRMQVLLRNCHDPSTRKQLINSYDMLTNPTKMGERFLFFSLLHPSRLAAPTKPHGLKLEKRSPVLLPVAGFTDLSFS